MATPGAGNEWSQLLSQTADLVTQDNYNFPRVERDINQLQHFAESLRAKTNNYRTLNNQIAATRLLAQQGFDASRLTQEVTSLEIQPTIEDVFYTETSTVEEYLQQVEQSTILAALQEAQQQTVAAFDAHMEECMAHDWAANKRHLFGLVAPHSGGGLGMMLSSSAQAGSTGAGGGGGGGPLIGTPSRAAGAGVGAPVQGPTLQLPPAERAYVDVITRANQATATNNQNFDLVSEFKQACKATEARSSAAAAETTMRSCWSILADMLAEVRARGVPPAAGPKLQEALAAGARKHLEAGHCQHMRSTVVRHKVLAERGADPEPLREVQAYIQVKLGGSSRGVLDFQAPGGHDTSWLQVYFALRNGWVDAARRAAERAQDVSLARLGEAGFKGAFDEWLRNGRCSDRTSLALARACETLLRDKAALKTSVRAPYVVLVCSLLAGDARALDALVALLAQLQAPPVLATIEDFMWARLMLLQAHLASSAPGSSLSAGLSGMGGGLGSSSLSGSLISGGGPPGTTPLPLYTLADLQADINRWPATYYSKQGKEPLLYVTVLLLSLQFQAALRFLWQDDMARQYRVDAVHLAIALHQEGLLAAAAAVNGDPGPDVSAIVQAYGRKFVHHDSTLALQYYMLAAQARGNSIAVKGQLLRELLSESRDFGTLLGGGSGPGGPPGGALGAYVRDAEERKRLYEAVAYECQVAAQSEEAVELYLAADRPRQALAVLNTQLSALLPQAAQEAATGVMLTGAAESVQRIMTRGRDARERIGPGADAGARREVEAWDQLIGVWDLLLASNKARHDLALQKLHELAFIPLEKARVEHCSRAAQSTLHPAVQERLADVLAAAATTIAAQRAGADRATLYTLRGQLEALCSFANSISFRVPQAVYQKLCEVAATF